MAIAPIASTKKFLNPKAREKIKNGVIRKPPPTPNNPERIPTIVLRVRIVNILIDTSATGRKISIN